MFIDLGDPVANYPLNDGLVGWWLGLPNNSGGGTLFDLLGRSPGTLTNGPTWSDAPNSFAALLFDGTDDRVNIPLTTTVGTSDYAIALSVRTTAANVRVAFGTNAVSDGFWIGTFSGTASFASGPFLIGAGSVNDGAWHRMLGTRIGATTTLYVDGKAVSVGSDNTNIVQAGYAIGDFGQATAFPWLDGISDCRLHIGRGMSAEDAVMDYQQSQSGYPNMLRRWSRRSSVYVTASPPPASTGQNLLLLGVG